MCVSVCVCVHVLPRRDLMQEEYDVSSYYYYYVSSYYYIYVLILLYMWPHTAIYVSSYY